MGAGGLSPPNKNNKNKSNFSQLKKTWGAGGGAPRIKIIKTSLILAAIKKAGAGGGAPE